MLRRGARVSSLSILAKLIIYSLISFLAFLYSGEMNPDRLNDLVESLLVVSGMVFTMMGIWIGLIYPNLLYASTSNNVAAADFDANGDGRARLEVMVWSVLLSGLAALLILVFRFLDSLFMSVVPGIGVSIVAFSALVQTEALLYVIRVSAGFVSLLYAKDPK